MDYWYLQTQPPMAPGGAPSGGMDYWYLGTQPPGLATAAGGGLTAQAGGASTSTGTARAVLVMVATAAGGSTTSGSATAQLIRDVMVATVAALAELQSATRSTTGVYLLVDGETQIDRQAAMVGALVDAASGEAHVSGLVTVADAASDRVQVTGLALLVDGLALGRAAEADCVEFRLVDRYGEHLTWLPNVVTWAFAARLNEPDAGELELPEDAAEVAQVAPGRLVLVYYRGLNVGAWLVEEVRRLPLERRVLVRGRGLLALAEYARVAEGTGTVLLSGRPGAILRQVVEAASLRGALDLRPGFGDTVDSAGRSWPETVTVEVQAGRTVLELVRQLAGWAADLRVRPDRTLLAYVPPAGRDLSTRVVFRVGDTAMAVERVEDLADVANSVTVVGQGGATATAEDPDSVAAYGRREAVISVASTGDVGTLQKVADTVLAERAWPLVSYRLAVTTGRWRPWLDYELGDVVRVEAPGLVADLRVRGITLRARDSGELCNPVVELELGDPQQEALVRATRALEAMLSALRWQSTTPAAATDPRPAAVEGHTHTRADVTDYYAPEVLHWHLAGTVAAGTAVAGWRYVPQPMLVGATRVAAAVAPAGGSVVWDVEFATSLAGPWTSVYSQQPTLAAGAQEGGQDAVPQGSPVGPGWLRLNVVEVPATPPQDVDVLLELFAGP